MQIVSFEDGSAGCEAKGVRSDVRLDLLDGEVAVGDFVIVHAGYAIRRVSEREARDLGSFRRNHDRARPRRSGTRRRAFNGEQSRD
jgi:hydrogenase expression/formation protein HypC